MPYLPGSSVMYIMFLLWGWLKAHIMYAVRMFWYFAFVAFDM